MGVEDAAVLRCRVVVEGTTVATSLFTRAERTLHGTLRLQHTCRGPGRFVGEVDQLTAR